MSMRPVDLQTVVPRVAETARVERAGQQVQDKAAAEAASQNQETARKGHEEVAQTRPAEEGRIARDRGGGGRGRGRGGQAKGGREGPVSHGEGEPGKEPESTPSPSSPPEPGEHLDLRM